MVENIENSGDWDCTYVYYYDGQKVIETHNGSEQVISEHLWGLQYIDELVQIAVNDDPADAGEDDCESVYYACHNANFNVLGVVDDSGDLIERYEYTPYGERVVFVSSGSNDADTSAPALESARVVTAGSVTQPYGLCEVGHQGLIHDKETALIYNRARMHHPRRVAQVTRVTGATPPNLFAQVAPDHQSRCSACGRMSPRYARRRPRARAGLQFGDAIEPSGDIPCGGHCREKFLERHRHRRTKVDRGLLVADATPRRGATRGEDKNTGLPRRRLRRRERQRGGLVAGGLLAPDRSFETRRHRHVAATDRWFPPLRRSRPGETHGLMILPGPGRSGDLRRESASGGGFALLESGVVAAALQSASRGGRITRRFSETYRHRTTHVHRDPLVALRPR